jgi:hypothetical protein
MTSDGVMFVCLRVQVASLTQEVRSLRDVIGGLGSGGREPGLAAVAAQKLALGLSLSRPEVAAYLGVSTKKIQRMEAAGTLNRCPGLGSVVRFAARDVLRLASAR